MTAMSTEPVTVRLQRTIAAPPARVYRAWLDPELLAQWIAPWDRRVTRAEVEERPGGRVSIHQADEHGDIGGMEAEVLELVPDERLVFNWSFVGPDREADPGMETRLTVVLREVDEGTELTLVHERLEGLRAAMPQVADKVTEGWNAVFDKLVKVF
jgi:uncharacterized protein YndB with AHSA1/START domain